MVGHHRDLCQPNTLEDDLQWDAFPGHADLSGPSMETSEITLPKLHESANKCKRGRITQNLPLGSKRYLDDYHRAY